MMKIAVTTRLLRGRLEGIGHHTYELLNRLIIMHPDIEWHLINDGQKDQILLPHANIIYHKLHPPTRHPLLWYYWYEWALPRLLSRIGAGVVWYPDGMMSLTANVPSLLTIHDLAYIHFPKGTISSHRRYLQWLMPRQVQKADHIASVSDFTLRDLRNSFEITEEKLSVTYNAANEKFRPYSSVAQDAFRKKYTGSKPYFLYLGSLHPRKNIVRLIQAYDLYRSKNTEEPMLVLAGRMAWKSEEIKQALERADYRHDIIHLSEIDDIIHLLVGSAQAMVYISLWEGFGMPVLEAMQSGVPLMTSRDSAMQEVAGSVAIYVDPYDIASIKQGLHKSTLTSDEQIIRIQEGILKAKDFNWDNSAEKLSNQLHSIIK